MVSCSKCSAISVRPSRRRGLGETLAYALLFRRPYRCMVCQHRFVAIQVGLPWRPRRKLPVHLLPWRPRRKLPMLPLVTMLVLGSLYIVVDNPAAVRVVKSSVEQVERSTSARRAQVQVQAQRRAAAAQKTDLERKARAQVRRSIKRHRAGQQGVDIVKIVSDPRDDTRKLIVEVFKSAGVAEKLINESLKDWDEGINVMEIGREWQNKGIDIRSVIQRAEAQGFPVRRIMREKDTQR